MPLVSIIMSVYNGEKTVSSAIDSIITQSFNDFEFIIIDDGSTDDTKTILEEFSLVDNRIKIISRENKGLIDSLNDGIALARGKYIARQDDDDRSHYDRLRQQVCFLEKNDDYVLCGTSHKVVDENGDFLKYAFLPECDKKLRSLIYDGVFAHGSVMIRKSALDCIGYYNRTALYCEDYELFIRLSRIGKIHNLKNILYSWTQRNSSVSALNKHAQAANKIYISEYYKNNPAHSCVVCENVKAKNIINSKCSKVNLLLEKCANGGRLILGRNLWFFLSEVKFSKSKIGFFSYVKRRFFSRNERYF